MEFVASNRLRMTSVNTAALLGIYIAWWSISGLPTIQELAA